jgi:hypothetical protein
VTARSRRERHSRRASCRPARVRGSGVVSSGRRRAVVWPPSHRRDRQRGSLARTDPARRGKPAWAPEGIRLATPVGDLQADVFIEGGRSRSISNHNFPETPTSRLSQSERWRQYLPRRASIQDRGGRLPAPLSHSALRRALCSSCRSRISAATLRASSARSRQSWGSQIASLSSS